jgi:hypothetical protein
VIELLIRAGYQPFGVPIRGLENHDIENPGQENPRQENPRQENPGQDVHVITDVENEYPGNLRLGDNIEQ